MLVLVASACGTSLPAPDPADATSSGEPDAGAGSRACRRGLCGPRCCRSPAAERRRVGAGSSRDGDGHDAVDLPERAAERRRRPGAAGRYPRRAARLHAARERGHALQGPLRARSPERELSDNARTAIVRTPGAIAYIGELAPGTSEDSVGITNALDLLQVSPTDTALELTQKTAAVPDAPSMFYEDWSSYGRTFARVVPSSAQEATGARSPRCARCTSRASTSADDGSDYGSAIALAVRQDAPPCDHARRRASRPRARSSTARSSPAAGGAVLELGGDARPERQAVRTLGARHAGVRLRAVGGGRAQHLHLLAGIPAQTCRRPARTSFIAPFTAAYGHTPAPQAIFGYRGGRRAVRCAPAGGRERQQPSDGHQGLLQAQRSLVGARHLLDRARRATPASARSCSTVCGAGAVVPSRPPREPAPARRGITTTLRGRRRARGAAERLRGGRAAGAGEPDRRAAC